MGLTDRLRRAAYARPHLLLAVAPGGTATRLATERWAREQGWPLAESPADADVLAVCGRPGPALAAAADLVWSQLPAPRVRVEPAGPDRVAAVLQTVPERLSDWDTQRLSTRDSSEPAADQPEPPADGPGDHGHGEHDHGEHGHGHGHGGVVAGLPMADRAPDRDGLMLDRLQVSFGPVLPHWPAGLRLWLAVQGDVVQEARVEVLDAAGPAAGPAFWNDPDPRRRAASQLDSLGRLLAVAGWDGAALRCQRLRDGALAREPAASLTAQLRGLARRLDRSRLLAAMTDGVGALDPAAADRHGVTGPALRGGIDVAGRWRQWLVDAGAALAAAAGTSDLAAAAGTADRDADGAVEGPRGRLDGRVPPSRALLDVLPDLVVGAELAAVRLIVASLDPDVDELAVPAPAGVPDGH